MSTPDARYMLPAIALHWVIALLLLCGFALGSFMVEIKFSPQKLSFYAYHKWIGVTIFVLAAVRLAWRLTHRPPPLPAALPQWQVGAAGATHFLMYALLFATPLSGWLYSTAAGVPTVPFGVDALQLPDLVAKDKELALTLKFFHLTFIYSLAGLVLLHVGAAIMHQVVDAEGVLRRMWPGGR